MRTSIAAATTASTLILAGISVPASAYTIEHVGTDCRINLTRTESVENRIFNPLYFTQQEVQQEKERIESEISLEESLSPGEGPTDTGYGKQMKFYLEILNKCQDVPQPKPEVVDKGSSDTGVLTGILGGIIGAVVAIAVLLGIKDFLPFDL